jgi:hypothetical protein
MIAIQKANGGFDLRWIDYCFEHGIDFKHVDCYKNDIIHQLNGCDAFMWQYYQGSIKDSIMAKGLLFSLEHAGLKVFPDFRTAWHFDDKVSQKYLLEAVGAPLAPTWVFYDKHEALAWAETSSFPKVFKLRGGAGSQNVRLVQSKGQAIRLIKKAFNKGFPQYDALNNLKDRWRLFRNNKTNIIDVLVGLIRFVIPPKFSKIKGREKGYIYFQEFMAGNDHDIRVIIIGNKAFAIKRMVRKNDFRASGSGHILYDKNLFDVKTILLSFEIAEKLRSQCITFDYVSDISEPKLVEISFGFVPSCYDPCPGYWDRDLVWHEGKFDPFGWMVEAIINDKVTSSQVI